MTLKYKIYSIILVALLVVGCGSVMKQVGQLTANLLTSKTSDLSVVSISAGFVRNMYSADVKTFEVEYLGENWREGANLVSVSFLKRDGVGMYTIDGKVFIDGTEIPHTANGFYGKWIDKNDISPKTIRIETVSGQVAEFSITPPPLIEIVSVNGKKSGMEIDLNSDLRLKMKSPQHDKNTEFSVSLVTKVMGINSFIESGIFKYKDDITLPAEIWKNPITPVPATSGANWLKVERFDTNLKVIKGVGASQIIGASIDVVPVSIKGEVETAFTGVVKDNGINIEETIAIKNGEMKVKMNKPNAFYGRPMSSGKTFALASFTVRATKLKQSKTDSSSSTLGGVKTTTTTTSTRTFPTLPDAFWDSYIDGLYVDLEKVLKSQYNIKLIPVENVLRAPSYQKLEAVTDENTIVEVEKSYKGTKNLIPTSFSSIVGNISSTFASDRVDAHLIRELGVDGLISVTIDLAMPWNTFTLSPVMSIQISGAPNGYKAGPTIFHQGTISGTGMPLDEAKMNAATMMDILPEVTRQKELMEALRQSFKMMEKKENELGYDAIWALK